MRKSLPEILDVIGRLLTLAAEDDITPITSNEVVLSFIPDDEILKKCLNKKGGSIKIVLKEIPPLMERELVTADNSSGYLTLSNDDFQVITPPSDLNIVPTLMSKPKSHDGINGKLPSWGELWQLSLRKLKIAR